MTINIVDMEPMIFPEPFAKIEFKGMDSKMLILPADRVGIRFGSTKSPFEAVRMQPNLNDVNLPEPFKSRYRT